MARTSRHSLLVGFTKLSATTLVGGFMVVCASGVAISADTQAAEGASTDSVTTTVSDTTAVRTESNIELSTNSEVSLQVEQAVSTEVTTDNNSNTVTILASGNNSELKDVSSTGLVALAIAEDSVANVAVIAKGDTENTAPIISQQPLVEAPLVSIVEEASLRIVYYHAVIDRAKTAQSTLEATPFSAPIVSDPGVNVPAGESNGIPTPVKTAGLWSAITIALGGSVVPNSISIIVKNIPALSSAAIRTISLIALLMIIIQGFINYMRRAGYSRAPRAGLAARINYCYAPIDESYQVYRKT